MHGFFWWQVIRIALALAQSGLGVEVGPYQVKQGEGTIPSNEVRWGLPSWCRNSSLHWFYRPIGQSMSWSHMEMCKAVCWRVTIMAVASLTVIALVLVLLLLLVLVLLLLLLFFFFFFSSSSCFFFFFVSLLFLFLFFSLLLRCSFLFQFLIFLSPLFLLALFS